MQMTTDIAALGIQKSIPPTAANHQLARHPICLSMLSLSLASGWMSNVEAAIITRFPDKSDVEDLDYCIYDGGLCVAQCFAVKCIGKCR